MAPKVFALVLNWNRRELTLDCLASLDQSRYANLEIVLVDNGSSESIEAEVKEKFPRLQIVQNGANLGYAGGNNAGIKKAQKENADFIFVLNNDTKLHPDCISELVQTAEEQPQFGILGPVAYDYENKEESLNSGSKMNWQVGDVAHFKTEAILNHQQPIVEVDIVQGDALFVRSEVFQKVGLFDDRFFLYFEESDFCIRARKAGYKAGIVKTAKFYRKTGGTIGDKNPLQYYYMTRNRFLFMKKNAELHQRISYLPRYYWEIFRHVESCYFRAKQGDATRGKRAKAILKGVVDYHLGRFGQMKGAL